MKKLLFLLLIWTNFVHATTYYVATTGSDSNPGTIGSPFATWAKLSTVMVAGDIAYIRGGTYRTTGGAGTSVHCLIQNLHGTITDSIKIFAYAGETPVFNFDNVTPTNTDPTGVEFINSEYVHIRGLVISGLRQIHSSPNGISRGFHMEAVTHCLFDNITVHHIGGYPFYIRDGVNDCVFVNCDAHHADDRWSASGAWGGSNGFDFTGGIDATRDTFRYCRAWWISDDGFDSYGTDGKFVYEGCQAFWNGYEPDSSGNSGTLTARGDGNGFKFGPAATNQSATVLKTFTNCIAFENRTSGFDLNNGNEKYIFRNNTSYKNGLYGWELAYFTGITQDLKNNVAYGNASTQKHGGSNSDGDHNTWNSGTVTDGDFLSVSSTGMDGARGADGSLPKLNFLRPDPGSALVNSGTNVGLPYISTAPDKGAFEYDPSAGNISPVANAGPDQPSIKLPTTSVSLSGTSSSDADGTISTYAWTLLSGPNSPTLTSPTSSITNVNGLVPGVYQFQLGVTDNDGATSSDVVIVTVSPQVQIITNSAIFKLAAVSNQNKIDLSWSGAFSSNTKLFTVYKRRSLQYRAIATINYSPGMALIYSDMNPILGTNYYLLKVTDVSGKVFQSPYANVSFKKKG